MFQAATTTLPSAYNIGMETKEKKPTQKYNMKKTKKSLIRGEREEEEEKKIINEFEEKKKK